MKLDEDSGFVTAESHATSCLNDMDSVAFGSQGVSTFWIDDLQDVDRHRRPISEAVDGHVVVE